MSKEILLQAIDKYGAHNQIDMLHDEIGELMKAINKMKRLNCLNATGFIKPNELTNENHSLAFNELCSEIADVKIMLWQLELMTSPEHIEVSYQRKIQRLKNNLENVSR